MQHFEKKPDFLIIGAQKAGTTWLWSMIDQHPGTSSGKKKEIHYFGSLELFNKGREWYYDYFENADPAKVIGEASTTYFYDRIPYWHNVSNQIEFDPSLPSLPQLVMNELPDVKIIIVLRDPVYRAISAYSHYTQTAQLSPFSGLKRLAVEHPKYRILEYGFYLKYLQAWQEVFPPSRFKVVIFEEDIRNNSAATLKDVYSFLELDPSFVPSAVEQPRNKSWTWTRIVFSYLFNGISPSIGKSRIGALFDQWNFLKDMKLKNSDIEFLAEQYKPEKEQLETLLGRSLDCWDYGEKLLKHSEPLLEKS